MSRRTHTLVLAGVATCAALSLTACGSSVDGSAHALAQAASTASATASASATPSATPAPVAAAPVGPAPVGPAPVAPARVVPAAGGPAAGPGGGAPPAPAPAGGGGGNPAPAPKITKFVISKQPSCPVHGTTDAPFSAPGNDVEISWTVTGASGAAIAVDDPGTYAAYGTYGTSGSLTLPFGCTDGKTTTHSYTVWPAGAKNVSKTISASAHSDN
ncbi:MAG TPA: hypothetical protein VGE11_11560 [Pseudonocardia sp.]